MKPIRLFTRTPVTAVMPFSSLSKCAWVLMFALGVINLSGCDRFEPPTPQAAEPQPRDVNAAALLSATNLFVYTQMSNALDKAQALDGVITTLLHQPNPGTLEDAQNAWIHAYSEYVKASFFTHVPRFEKPQFRDTDDTYARIEERIDSWPIEPGYIDYLPQYPLSGIVNDLTLKIEKTDILAQHGFSDARFASIGFQPMAFLLFGVDGKRSAKDFIPQENSVEVVTGELQATDEQTDLAENDSEQHAAHHHEEINGPQNHNRRRDYLRLLSGLVIEDLQKLADRWEPAHGYYAKQWRQSEPEQQTVNLTLIYQAVLDTLQDTLLERHVAVLFNQKQVDDLRSSFAQQDVNNMHDLLLGIELLFNQDEGLLAQMRLHDAETADKSTALFKRLLLSISKLPSNIHSQPLAKRQTLLTPIREKILQLLEQLYNGAEILRLPIRPLPVSTS